MEAMQEAANVEGKIKSNCFSLPWKNSDIVVVAGDEEFHVHRVILLMQSPVFEAMFNGDFKEAKQDRIILNDENPEEVLDFLKLLYPKNLFDYPLKDDNVLAMLALADKYQTETVLKECFNKTTISLDNALKILPYALKYDKAVCEKCIKMALRKVSSDTLKGIVPNLDRVQSEEILLGKCKLLEEALKHARMYLLIALDKIFELSKKENGKPKPKVWCKLSHEVDPFKFDKVRKCQACLVEYRKQFCKDVGEVEVDNGTAYDNSESVISNLEEIHDALYEVDLRMDAMLASQ